MARITVQNGAVAVKSNSRRRPRRAPADKGTRLPTGTVTFLMTDVESSTQAWNESPKAARQALEHHDRVVSEAVGRSRGQMVESGREGDSILAVFTQATDAVECALDLQRALQKETWPGGRTLHVRVAVHTGEADLENGHYVGIALYRCARIMATAHGGQTLLSTATQQLVADALPYGVTLLDLGAHHLRDLSRPEHIYQLVHDDLRRDFPPLKSAAVFPNNLPNLLTTFVDREEELRAIRTLLQTSRLVTLTGTGGAGKSRLAIEVAKASQDLWPDGRWWIELTAADDVADALVARLELPGRGAAIDVVSSWLATKRALVILDNCEHMVEACAELCEALLARSAELAILATSREPLRVHGEARWPLTALAVADALTLFEARARLVRPSFSAGLSAATVSEICQRLDRLPLAIEMAAARVDVMSEAELLRGLTSSFRTLESATRTAPERQQTMTATIDWSHRLLTDREATLFRRLAVFHGGFSLEAAEAVYEDPSADVFGLLSGLVRKSMAVAESSGNATRYRLLDSHRAYALAKLVASGEGPAVGRRHYDYFRAWLARTADPRARARESANLWAAIAWAKEGAEDNGLELATEVATIEYSDHARAGAVMLELLDRSKVRGASRARALNIAARLASRQGDHERARTLADASVAEARQVRDPHVVAQALSGAGVVHHAADELATARKMYDEALELARKAGDEKLAVETQNQLAVLATVEGRYSDAETLLAECIAFSRAVGDYATTARYLESEGNAKLGLGSFEAAAQSWREALETYRLLGDPFGTIWCLGGLALTAAAQHQFDRTLRLAAAVERMSGEWSLSAWPARLAQLEEACSRARRRLGGQRADAASAEGRAMTSERALAYALEEGIGSSEAAAEAGLSRREGEVLAMVAAGLTNKEIARLLFIAERTAEGHVERIRNKLGVRSRTEVAAWALTHGVEPAVLDKG